VLANIDLEGPIKALLDVKEGSLYAQPITAPQDADRSVLIGLLVRHKILQLPIIDSEQRVVGLVTRGEFFPGEEVPPQAVIMAGGAGLRLRPMTQDLPKPMLPVGNRPLMEILVDQLRDSGIRHLNVTVHHKSEKIIEHFGDGRDFGINITYTNEERPLGTAGALALIDPPKETLLVVNGDILTQLDFRSMLAYHREQNAQLTVATQRYDVEIPYGTIEYEGSLVKRLIEKPVVQFMVNAGIYLLEPSVLGYIKSGERYDMTDLIQRLLDEGQTVAGFPMTEYWIDIGKHDDYRQAQEFVNQSKANS
jgi:NDP-sugar pyrophosphorylase family protein